MKFCNLIIHEIVQLTDFILKILLIGAVYGLVIYELGVFDPKLYYGFLVSVFVSWFTLAFSSAIGKYIANKINNKHDTDHKFSYFLSAISLIFPKGMTLGIVLRNFCSKRTSESEKILDAFIKKHHVKVENLVYEDDQIVKRYSVADACYTVYEDRMTDQHLLVQYKAFQPRHLRPHTLASAEKLSRNNPESPEVEKRKLSAFLKDRSSLRFLTTKAF